ncbi:uncharacterized protein LOC118455258 [Neolamprologus brichardi]|uniref:uncharacterized protein LOC118455258 n=1 Tax=Neolamprologus brichardi TaxID=32507 RepID=UPI001643E87D|nr:uncharacterized protein LOC118455258 [Neolamprologus brichardi]
MEKILLGVLYVSGWLILCKCHQYHFVSQPLTWHEAARYCSTQYTGLAVTEDMNEMNQLKKKVSSAGYKSAVWINLHTRIRYYKKYYREEYFIKEDQKIEMAPFFVRFFCRSISLNGVRWNNNCSVEHPFICYNGTNPLGPEYVFVNESMDFFRALKYCRENFTELTRTWNKDVQSLLPNGTEAWVDTIGFVHNHWIINLKLKIDGASLNVKDSAVKADLLKKLQDKLNETGVSGVTLKWREQPDGEVFHKEGRNSQKEEKKRTEL